MKNLKNLNQKNQKEVTIKNQKLFFEISNRHYFEVEKLISAGVDVNARDKQKSTALIEAVYRNDIDIARLLIEAGADVNAQNEKGQTALMIAAYNNNLEMCQMLCDHIKNNVYQINASLKDKDGNNALMIAIENNSYRKDYYNEHLETLAKLVNYLSEYININERNKKGDTALHIALYNDNFTVAKILVKKGANVYIKNKKDICPVDIFLKKIKEDKI